MLGTVAGLGVAVGDWEGKGTGPPRLAWKNPERVTVRGPRAGLGSVGGRRALWGMARGPGALLGAAEVGRTELWLFTGDDPSRVKRRGWPRGPHWLLSPARPVA